MFSALKSHIPLPAKLFLYKIYSEYAPLTLGKLLGVAGYNVSRKRNFYSPLPDLNTLKLNRSRWDRPSPLRGIHCDMDSMRSFFESLLDEFLAEYIKIPPYAVQHAKGFGLGYTPVDALTLYLMIRHLKPRRYVEVGSGLSTYYCQLAADENRKEGYPLEITCIEPYPLKTLQALNGITLLQNEVQDVGLSVFEALESGDVLFIDSTHVVKIDGDVPYLFLEVLPSLAKGVNIHIHDIAFPYNSPFPADKWVFGQAEPMFWTEAMLLQGFLAFNSDFAIKCSLPLLRYSDEQFLKERIPIYETLDENSNAFSSIWLDRVDKQE